MDEVPEVEREEVSQSQRVGRQTTDYKNLKTKN